MPQWNIKQLSTLEIAQKWAETMGTQVGGGVKPYIEDKPEESGIYLAPWDDINGETPRPSAIVNGVQYDLWLYRFENGASGVNVGLVNDQFTKYPSTFVIPALAEEVNQIAPQ